MVHAGDTRSQWIHRYDTDFITQSQGLCSPKRLRIPDIEIPIINFRRSTDSLMFIMGIPNQWDGVILANRAPDSLSQSQYHK